MGKTTFQQLEAFCAVMQHGTTTQAARALNTTQPSISRRLAELQQRSGLLLVEMEKGRLKATAEGVMLYHAVQKHFSGLAQIDSVITKMKKSGTGVLHIGCTPTLGAGLLPEVIFAFKRQYPDVRLTMQTASSQQLLSLLDQQLIELMVTSSLLENASRDGEILRLAQAVCVLPLNHPLAQASIIGVDSLLAHEILSLHSDDEISRKVEQHFLIAGKIHQPVIETSSSITLCAMVCAQLGVAIVNPFVARLFSGKLLIKPFYPPIITPVHILHVPGGGLSLLAREFIGQIKQALGQQNL